MAEISFESRGVAALTSRFEAAESAVIRRVGEAVKDTTDEGVRIAKATAPVRTGRLRSEITGVASALSGSITSHVFYSGFVNFGTSRMAPNPYMGRTARAIEPLFAANVAEAGRAVL